MLTGRPGQVAFSAVVILLGWIWLKFYENRSRVNRLRKQGLPMPPWSWLFGHLVFFRQYQKLFPSDTFVPVVMIKMCEAFGNSDMFYLDLWPFSTAFLIVNDPEVAMQITSSKKIYPKPEIYQSTIDPVVGGPNILTMNGDEWKKWRAVFNPTFAQAHLLTQLPAIIRRVETFSRKLRERVGTVIPLEDLVTRLTMDIIIKIAMDDDSDYQNAPNALADSLRSIVGWSNFGNPFLHYHPIRPFALRYYGNIMDRYVRRALDTRYDEIKRGNLVNPARTSKSVLSLALKDHVSKQQPQELRDAKIDPVFAGHVVRQMRLFLFAGHDTTTSVLVYTYHMLSKHPAVLQKVRDEHTQILGPIVPEASQRLEENPSLLHQLPYTVAVIKETMRFYPPAGSEKAGSPDVYIIDRHGTKYPTEGLNVSIQHNGLHHNPRVWPRVNEFLPERWLVEEEHELYPPPGAFRVFEHGPRNCIGQNLAMLELRVALVLTVRTFGISPAYEEWDVSKPKRWMERIGLKRKKVESIAGERAYPVEKGAAHPKDGYPCRVSLLET